MNTVHNNYDIQYPSINDNRHVIIVVELHCSMNQWVFLSESSRNLTILLVGLPIYKQRTKIIRLRVILAVPSVIFNFFCRIPWSTSDGRAHCMAQKANAQYQPLQGTQGTVSLNSRLFNSPVIQSTDYYVIVKVLTYLTFPCLERAVLLGSPSHQQCQCEPSLGSPQTPTVAQQINPLPTIGNSLNSRKACTKY